jgi:methionine sulfoxide reductase heme-binding subunit
MSEAAIHLFLRSTARTTFVLFALAFTGPALRELLPGSFSVWLARKRDWFLLAMAASHTLHLAAIIALFQTIGWAKLRMIVVVGGGILYLLIYSLAVNAFSRLRDGQAGFLIGGVKMEAVALYVLWLVFGAAFIPRMLSGWPVYSLLGSAALAAFAIRITCLVRHKRARVAAA